jgi:hypothetical protein
MLLGSIITIALVVGLLYFIRHKTDHRSSHKPHRSRKSRLIAKQPANNTGIIAIKNTAFHCVETHHHGKCCEAIKALHGKRFLSSEAPMLPVQGCDQAHCECDYVHHDDRRSDNRRTDMGLQRAMYGQSGEVEHRGKNNRGRRKKD